MHHKDVQSVVGDNPARNVEYVARGPHPAHRGHPQRRMGDWGKRKLMVEQSHVDAAIVGRVGHYVTVARVAQQRTLGQVAQYCVVFHLA